MRAPLSVTPYAFYIAALALGHAAGRETREGTQQTPPVATATVSTVSIPISPCVDECVKDALEKARCTSLSDILCVCSGFVPFGTSLEACVKRSCTPEDEAAANVLSLETCSMGSVPPPGSVLSLSTVAISSTTSHVASPIQVPPSSLTPPSQNTGAPIAPSTSQPDGEPAAATSVQTSPIATHSGGESTDSAGAQVTVVVTTTSSIDDGDALNPSANDALSVRQISWRVVNAGMLGIAISGVLGGTVF
ncbi:hypothetical protein BC628DRAFT_1367224 [Trametes gibbosa]|nr:hypothetical protein BC628DRAFT_1367224 [Trametes gibbosa]